MRQDDKTTIYVFRHGQTHGNVRKQYDGHNDVSLTEVGEAQARARATEFKDVHFDAVYSSDLIRAKHTAELIKAERDLEVKTSELLRERSYGHFEGKNKDELLAKYDEIFHKYELMVNHEDRLRFDYGGIIEGVDALVTRFVTVMREIALANLGKTVMIVCHGSIMRAFLGHLNPDYYKQRFDNTGWFKVESDGVNFQLEETSGLIPIVLGGKK